MERTRLRPGAHEFLQLWDMGLILSFGKQKKKKINKLKKVRKQKYIEQTTTMIMTT